MKTRCLLDMEEQVMGPAAVTRAQKHPEADLIGNAIPQEPGEDLRGCKSQPAPGSGSPTQQDVDVQKVFITEQVWNDALDNQGHPVPAEDHTIGTQQLVFLDANGQSQQYERVVIVTGVIPSSQLERTQVLLPQGQLLNIAEPTGEEKLCQTELQTVSMEAITETQVTAAPALPTQGALSSPLKTVLPGAPSWTRRLRDCEKIGESYRGYCATEADLEALLLLHKRLTHSVFGTRQSPSPAKPATRLMWKSQYVPYDGIPFVNAGSRAIVMECQYGPRRKGLQPKRVAEQENNHSSQYKATCPARIYIKKVRKFPEYTVSTDPKVDKKVLRQEQEKAFFNLKKSLWDAGGVLRYYIQLPTEKAHQYHDVDTTILSPLPDEEQLVEEDEGCDEGLGENGSSVPSRLHPRVVERICELVAQGHHQVYTIRKQLRKFVEREMFKPDQVPERHNLCYFPTINDIKNHIHEAQKALQQKVVNSSPANADLQWTLTPTHVEESQKDETTNLFSSLTAVQPKIFAQLQIPSVVPSCSEGTTQSCVTPDLTNPSSPSEFLRPSTSLEGVSLTDCSPLLGVGQLVSVSVLGEVDSESGIQQVLLDEAHPIPVHMVEPSESHTKRSDVELK